MDDGKTVACGTFAELCNSKIDFISLLNIETKNDKNKNQRPRAESLDKFSFSCESDITVSMKLRPKRKNTIKDTEKQPLIAEETKQNGAIDPDVYWEYIKTGAGPFLIISIVMFMVISQSLFHGCDLFLADWYVNIKTFFQIILISLL